MSISQNVDIIKNFFDLIDKQGLSPSELKEYIDPEFKDRDRPEQFPRELSDVDATVGFFIELKNAFPNGRHQVSILEELSDERVLVRWRFTGTHSGSGSLFGMSPTNRDVDINGFDVFRLSNQKITEQWHIQEQAKLYKQLT